MFCFLSLAGCGRSGPEIVQVEGRLTYGGGSWPKKGTIFFLPVKVEGGAPERSGWARFGIDGRFGPTSYRSGDGLVPGVYRVTAECWERTPTMGLPPPNYVPAKYQSSQSSDLEVTVPSGQRRLEVSLDIPKKK